MLSPCTPGQSYRWYEGDREQQIVFWICSGMICSLALAALALFAGVEAPYGRYNTVEDNKHWALKLVSVGGVNAKLAFALQECPTLVAAAVWWFRGNPECKASAGNLLVFSCFVCHYVNRTIIYPLRMRGSKPIPFPIMVLAGVFCGLNGYVQCCSVLRLLVVEVASPSTMIGITLWAAGLYVNTDADKILRNLRKPGEKGYKIPRGGMFDYVSGANFFGEILEWIGYAIAMGGALPGVMFATCTACNVAPRALSHHKWYLEKFKDEYPKERRALIPFVL
mmetsp:Transcript_43623/g.120707  ORF Transcript_43623/g.120707 Transcript_43623/m.120707 type:complete len:280 (+) Transcript_43623:55-894(+)